MKKITFTIFTIVILAGIVVYNPVFAVTHTVQVGNFYFSPSSLNVNVGDVVEWVWVAGSHTTTSTSIPGGAASWDQPINSSNQTYSYTVTTAGTYNYVCTPHAAMGMVGSFVATTTTLFVTVTPSNQNVASDAGTTNFSVTSNTSWNASCDKAWCTVTGSGSGNGTITANYTMNPSTDLRIATITVTATGVPDQVVTVTQAGAAATLSVTPPSQSVSESAGTTDFSVTSNSTWTSASDAAWCTVTPSGTGNGTIVATYEANTTLTERTANISVTVTGLAPVVVQVIQDGSNVGISETNMNTIRVYPNPATNFVNFSFDKSSGENIRISFVDLNGKIILDRTYPGNKEVSINVRDLTRGYYFVKLLTNNQTVTRKLFLIN